MNTTSRLVIVAALIGATRLGASAMRGSGPATARYPDTDLRALPAQLGPWTADAGHQYYGVRPRPDEPALALERTYRNRAGQQVLLVVEAFLASGSRVRPHPPVLCYSGSGYQLVSHRVVTVPVDADLMVPARNLLVQRAPERMLVLYWYQWNGRFVTEDYPMWIAHRECLGERTWPPKIKVMLQTESVNEEEAEATLQSIAAPLAAWMRQVR